MNIIEFKTEDNEILLIEVEAKKAGTYRGSNDKGDKDSLFKAEDKFEKALATLKTLATATMRAVRDIADSPDEYEVKVGLKFTAEANVILAKSSAEGNFEVTMKWKNKTDPTV